MKNNKVLFIILGIVLFLLLGTSVYVNFIAKSSGVVSYVILSQIILGVVATISTLYLCKNKKNHQVMFIAFLEILFSLSLVIFNTVYGYNKVMDINDYSQYMEYTSMNMNIYMYIIFAFVIGVFCLNSYIRYINDKK